MLRFIFWSFGFCLLASTLWLTVHRPAHPTQAYWIAFSSNRDQVQEIYRMLPDGSNPIRLTHRIGQNVAPQWSPDAQWLLFSSYNHFYDTDSALYRMQNGGAALQKLTPSLGGDYQPSWSPDSRWIVFTARDSQEDLYLMTADGKFIRRLPGHPKASPTWSPDSQWLAFASQTEIYRLKLDTSEVLEQLTSGEGAKSLPSWSPDGQWLAYIMEMPTQQMTLHLLSLHGGTPQVITTTTGSLSTPIWSPNSQALAFERRTSTNKTMPSAEIVVYHLPNQQERLILRLETQCHKHPNLAWTPDSRHLITDHGCEGADYDLYRINIESLAAERLTDPAKQHYATSNWGAAVSPVIDLPWQPLTLGIGFFCTAQLFLILAKRLG